MSRRLRVASALAVALAFAGARAQVSPGPLSKAHRSLEGNSHCLDCHASKKEGMDERCLGCHAEIAALAAARRGFHARVSQPCAKCHPEHAGTDFDLVEWPRGGETAFDHAQAGFPLAGKHATLKCGDCHQAKYRIGRIASLAKVKDASRSHVGLEPACAACHEDRHGGRFGPDCSACHAPTSWKDVSKFDHARTGYPLSGKHAAVSCAKCHQPDPAQPAVYRPLPHAECAACHKDVHGGRLGLACSKCHVTGGFLLVARGAFDHDRTRYPLRGAHRTVDCARCHDPKAGGGNRPAFAECRDCHKDPHAGQATLAGKAVDCATCHGVESFRPAVLAAAVHAPGTFPLDGKHAAAACAACHRRPGAPAGAQGVVMRPAHARCSDCHADAHGGQLASRPDRGECASCHTTAGWKPARFGVAEHASLALPLEGAHAQVPCGRCHGPSRPGLAAFAASVSPGKAGVVLRGVEHECVECHRDPHRFNPVPPCTDCHGLRTWSPANLGPDQHRRYAFPLEGAHAAVPCTACHKELVRPPSRSSLLRAAGPFPPLGLRDPRRRCAECHEDPHRGRFAATAGGAGCERCHVPAAWRPASAFDHARDAGFRLGPAHAKLPCSKCHPATLMTSAPAAPRRPRRCEDCHTRAMPPSPGDRP